MIQFSIITVFPELHDVFFKTSILARSIEEGIIAINFVKLSDMVEPKQRIDEPTCGPGAGMIIKPGVIQKAIELCEQQWGKGCKIFFSPQGKRLDQNLLKSVATKVGLSEKEASSQNNEKQTDHIILVCSRYEGIDERVQDNYSDLVLSIGDYVLMGGDIPAQVFIEGFCRLLPGVVGKKESVKHESFSGPFLDYPEYGLPADWQGKKVPEVVLSGDHGKIEVWRKQEAAKKTMLSRFDWFRASRPNYDEVRQGMSHIPPHYVAIMHTQINIKGGRVGESSIASLDIHDIARSSKTYGMKNFFIVTPLKDQQEIMKSFLGFWHSIEGFEYNKSRYDAVKLVIPALSLQAVIESITQKEGKRPLLIATSAKQHGNAQVIDFSSQSLVWGKERPVLFILGTGQGLADGVLDQSDFLLMPIQGLTDYNHLSVRSAAAVIFDRWLGLQPKKGESSEEGIENSGN